MWSGIMWRIQVAETVAMQCRKLLYCIFEREHLNMFYLDSTGFYTSCR